MANWNKQYAATSTKSDVMRALGFATLKCDDINDREEMTNNLEELVDAQIRLERENTKIQRDKGYCIGLFVGAAATYVGWFVGGVIKAKLNKK